jgi:hypothetical protein
VLVSDVPMFAPMTRGIAYSTSRTKKYGVLYTDKKEKKIIPHIRKFRVEHVAKSFMRKGFLIYFPIYEEAVSHTLIHDFATAPL